MSMKEIKLSPEQEARAIEKYVQGTPVRQILDYLGVSAGRFYTVLNQHGIERTNKHSRATKAHLERLTLQDKLDIIQARLDKHTLESIYYKWKINKNTFYTIWEQRAKFLNEAKQLENLDELIVED